jgi:uncharacterized protein
MTTRIAVTIGQVMLEGELFDTPSGREIANTLPIEAIPNEWGDEFYFAIPVTLPLDETATRRVKVGDIGYWPPGRALAIFFGPTPLSPGFEPVPASEVNLVGRINGDVKLLRKAKGAKKVRIEKG